jgi:fumarate reductase flavoprotein subunit
MFREQYTRRDFLKKQVLGAAGAAGAATLAQAGIANASESNDSDASADDSGNPSWLGPEPQIADSEITETVDCDVVVCGGGTSGLFAAAAAAENGAKTVMIDVAKEGEGSGIRDDLGVINSKCQQRAGAEIDTDALYRLITRTGGYYSNGQLVSTWIDESGAAFDWYEERLNEAGLSTLNRLVDVPEGQEEAFSTCCGIDWGDYQLQQLATDNNGQQIILPYIENLGVDCRFETRLIKCVKESDRVTGVIAQTSDGYIQINAKKGVILCCGGYMGNEEMMRALQPWTVDMVAYNAIWPNTVGDGIKAGLWAGAKQDPLHFSSTWEQGLIAPDKTVEEVYNDNMDFAWLGPLPFLRVNLDGERFMNESGTYGIGGHAMQYQPNSHFTEIQVFDSSWKEDAEQFNYYSAERYFPYDNGAAPLFTVDVVEEYINQQVEDGMVVTADTIEELAEKIGVPSDNLVATVERYNELVAKGHDDDFHKPAYRMSAIDEPPYYACRFGEQGSHTMDGLLIDKDMRVLDTNMNVIPGLFAAGDNSGGFIGVTYLGVAAGNAAGRSITFGRHAGTYAATHDE